MPVVSQATPNPDALKFVVGEAVGGPRTYTAANAAADPTAGELLEVEGVEGVFMTADFVTLTKTPGADWADIEPQARAILEQHFPGP